MRKFLTKVTVSGVGDSTDPHDLIALAEEFPFVEFGIQLARGSKTGWSRFPSDAWLAKLVDTCCGRGMNFSGHICFEWVREILLGRWPERGFSNIHKDFMSPGMFQRWQINTHGEPHDVDYMKLPHSLLKLRDNGQTVIFQQDGVNDEIVQHCKELELNNIAALFDTSHGAGILPDEWPEPLDGICCGYAGGLSPANVAGELSKIGGVIGNAAIWIDAERQLRSDCDTMFDLRKVREFLLRTRPWVMGHLLH